MTEWDRGLLAVGSAPDTWCGPDYVAPRTGEADLAGAWTSRDGVTWERLASPDFPDDVDGVWFSHAADVGSGVLIVGGTMRFVAGPEDGTIEAWEPFAWFSNDGATWTDATPPVGAFDHPEAGWLSRAIATPSRVFVIWEGGLWVWGAPEVITTR